MSICNSRSIWILEVCWEPQKSVLQSIIQKQTTLARKTVRPVFGSHFTEEETGWERLKNVPLGQTVRVCLLLAQTTKHTLLGQKKHFPIVYLDVWEHLPVTILFLSLMRWLVAFEKKNSQQIQMFLEYSPKSDHWVKLLEEGCALSYLKKNNNNMNLLSLKWGI